MSDSKHLAEMVEKCGGEGYAERTLAREQPCGCLVCICEDEEHCHGCGARFCGNHFSHVDRIPNPKWIEDTPKPISDNLAWLKAWMLADRRRTLILLDVLSVACRKEDGVPFALFMLRLTDAQFAECLIEAAEKCLGSKP